MDDVRRLADAVLYEGHVLWPYRRSAVKNRQRWTFGGVYPQQYAAAFGDRSIVRFQCLVEGYRPVIGLELRFLQAVHRQCTEGPELAPVDRVGGYLTWDEARERTVEIDGLAGGEWSRRAITVRPGHVIDPVDGGALVRTWQCLAGLLEAALVPLGPALHRLEVSVANTARRPTFCRDEAIARTLLSAHVIATATSGSFVSAIDPPARLTEHASALEQAGLWPVLVGEEGDATTVLAAPIILPDHARVAPESPGDFFDGGEIDQLLVLNILGLTDAEKQEIAAGDPRAREVLERTEAMTADDLARLNGAIRDLRPAARP